MLQYLHEIFQEYYLIHGIKTTKIFGDPWNSFLTKFSLLYLFCLIKSRPLQKILKPLGKVAWFQYKTSKNKGVSQKNQNKNFVKRESPNILVVRIPWMSYIWWNIFLIKYVISNTLIFLLEMGIRFSNKVYNLIKKVVMYWSTLPVLVSFEIDHLASLVLFWIKNQIPILSPSVKIQIMGGKVCLMGKGKTLLFVYKCLLTTPSNVWPFTFSTHNLNFHWRWWDQIQTIYLNLFYFN